MWTKLAAKGLETSLYQKGKIASFLLYNSTGPFTAKQPQRGTEPAITIIELVHLTKLHVLSCIASAILCFGTKYCGVVCTHTHRHTVENIHVLIWNLFAVYFICYICIPPVFHYGTKGSICRIPMQPRNWLDLELLSQVSYIMYSQIMFQGQCLSLSTYLPSLDFYDTNG